MTLGHFHSTHLIWTVTSPIFKWLGPLTRVTTGTWKGRWGSDKKRDRAMGYEEWPGLHQSISWTPRGFPDFSHHLPLSL